MTIITIDEPIKLKKNKFASIMEAMYYLALAGQKQAVSKTKKQYLKAKQDYEQGVNIYNQDDLTILMQQRGLIK